MALDGVWQEMGLEGWAGQQGFSPGHCHEM